MPKLVSISLYVGRKVRIGGVQHRVKGFEQRRSSIVLERDDDSGSSLTIPRSELYAQIVEESAELVDDTEDPDLAASMPEINPAGLSIDRAIDWYHKMILLRHLLQYAQHSPRSERFRREYERARHILDWVRNNSGIASQKNWRAKTLNDDLRRWRHAGFSLAALQVKGLQYRPWKKRSTKYVRARTLAQEIRHKHPTWSAAAVRRMTQSMLRKNLQSMDAARGLTD